MKRILVLLATALALAAPATAKPKTVKVKGHVYATGLLHKEPDAKTEFRGYQALGLPKDYDARKDKLVSPVRNQGGCGSCWAHARTKAFEAQLLKAGKSADLAEQDPLVNDSGSYGCDGGFMDASWEVAKGQTTEDRCPYKGDDSVSCRGKKYAKASRWGFVGARSRAPSIEELKTFIYKYGVIPVTVAAGNDFAPGRDGRITSCGSKQVNHMVTLAGWRTLGDGTTEFLIVNSWGKGWGVQGTAWSRQGCNKLASTRASAMYLEL